MAVGQVISLGGSGDGGGDNLVEVSRTVTGSTATFVAGDLNKMVVGNRATAQTFTIPLQTMATGDVIGVWQLGVGQITIAVANGAKQTLNAAKKSGGQNTMMLIWCYDGTVDAEVYKIIGGVE